jgi:glycosyltransferase involved in cell wall biosynthesis
MSKVLFVQNTFVPDQNQFSRLEKSIRSLQKYLDGLETENEYHYALAGWIAPEYRDKVNALWRGLMKVATVTRVTIFPLQSNLGKGIATNRAVKTCSNMEDVDFDYLFMFDSDIRFEDTEQDIVQILIEQTMEMDLINPAMRYPVMSCNFKEHQVHNEGVLDFGHRTKHGVVRCSTGNFGCVGGGCWLVAKDHWDTVGGYTEDAIYGKDDGKFYLDTIRLVKDGQKHMVGMAQDVYVIHPSDTDDEYNRFKADTNVNRVRKMTYAELAVDSDKFWNERNK